VSLPPFGQCFLSLMGSICWAQKGPQSLLSLLPRHRLTVLGLWGMESQDEINMGLATSCVCWATFISEGSCEAQKGSVSRDMKFPSLYIGFWICFLSTLMAWRVTWLLVSVSNQQVTNKPGFVIYCPRYYRWNCSGLLGSGHHSAVYTVLGWRFGPRAIEQWWVTICLPLPLIVAAVT
jgi:hypothetical protein